MRKNIPNKGHKIFTGVAGEYFVVAEISKRNAIATITSKNTPNIDILASGVDGKRTANIQVKAGRGTTGGFIVGNSPMKPLGSNFFFVFVFLKDSGEPDYWVIPQAVVAKISESDYSKWIKGRPMKSKKAPRTLRWEHLKSNKCRRYYNNWAILNIFK